MIANLSVFYESSSLAQNKFGYGVLSQTNLNPAKCEGMPRSGAGVIDSGVHHNLADYFRVLVDIGKTNNNGRIYITDKVTEHGGAAIF